MNTVVKREIHALDYTLCVLLSLLDRIFRRRLDWWDISRGLNVKILDRQADVSRDVHVLISPVGWADDEWIAVRCEYHSENGWMPFKGCVHSSRLPDTFNGSFNFKIVWVWPFIIRGRYNEEKGYITEAVPECARLNK